ncbi:uncharacterized protein LOC121911615 isoform X2 [Thunnus maccoyii]|uniref:uncharacterized protein LOC121911615 isoform X2 n=1 Tax=Thunnus maccoyii TaxID=8240 RepID=UPI001C4D1B0C|nr:uncharacterized protein LOC121911615 isoform X2 [Thunnus maccoyii]
MLIAWKRATSEWPLRGCVWSVWIPADQKRGVWRRRVPCGCGGEGDISLVLLDLVVGDMLPRNVDHGAQAGESAESHQQSSVFRTSSSENQRTKIIFRRSWGSWSPSQLTLGERRSTPWTGRRILMCCLPALRCCLSLICLHSVYRDMQTMSWVPVDLILTTGGTPKPNIHNTEPPAVKLCFAARREFFSEVKVSSVQGRKLHVEKLPRRVRELPLLEKVGLENEGWVVWEKERRIRSVDLLANSCIGWKVASFQQDQSSISLKCCGLHCSLN